MPPPPRRNRHRWTTLPYSRMPVAGSARGSLPRSGWTRTGIDALAHLPALARIRRSVRCSHYRISQCRSSARRSASTALVATLGGPAMVGQEPSIVELGVAPSPRTYTDAEMKEIDALPTKNPAELTDAESQRLKDLIGFSPNDMPGGPPTSIDETVDPFANFA